MALYALDGDRLVYAAEAEEKKIYRCRGCSSPVRVRRGPFRVPHYFHQTRAPTCRLYSKSEDHLLAQLAIQALLPPGEGVIEHPLLDIHRISDLFWAPHRISFEIQCSLLTVAEVEKRERDYSTAGYQVVWILDDRLYNRRRLRPAEARMRSSPSYYATLRRQTAPVFYDQFEIFSQNQRLAKGHRLRVHLNRPRFLDVPQWNVEDLPTQLHAKANTLYFEGDLVHKALLAQSIQPLAFSMQNLKALETKFEEQIKAPPSLLRRIVLKWVLEPFGLLMLNLMEWAEKKG